MRERMRLQRVRLHKLPVTGVLVSVDYLVLNLYFSRYPVAEAIRQFDLTRCYFPDISQMSSVEKRRAFVGGIAFCDHVDALKRRYSAICTDALLPHLSGNAAELLFEATRRSDLVDWHQLIDLLDDDGNELPPISSLNSLLLPGRKPTPSAQPVPFRRKLPEIMPAGSGARGFLGVQFGPGDGLHGVKPEPMDPEEFRRLKAHTGSMAEPNWNDPPPEFPLHPDMDRGRGRKK